MLRRLALLLLALALAACTRTTDAGDTVRFAIAADPQTLDPLFAHADAAGVEGQLARLAFEPFVDVDDRGRLVPVLITRIPTVANGDLSRDGKTIVYHLRPGVRWHDGVPVDAGDVLFTLRAIVDQRNPVRSRDGYDRIESAIALDAHTVRITLREPWAPAVATLFGSGTAPQYVLPAHLLDHQPRLDRAGFGAAPIGDGTVSLRGLAARRPARLHGEPAVLARGAEGVAVGDSRAPRSGDELHRDPKRRARLEPALAGAVVDGSYAQRSHVPVRAAGTRRRDRAQHAARAARRRARAARARGGDRSHGDQCEADLRALPAYRCRAAAALVGARSDWRSCSPLRSRGGGPRAFDAAGWRRGADGLRTKNGKRIALVSVQFPVSQTGVRVAAFVERALRVRGIDVTIKSVSNAQLFLPASQGGVLASGAFDLAYVPWPMGADPDDSALLGCGGPQNIMHWCDPAVDALQQRALVAASQDARSGLYAQIEHRVAAAVPIVYLFDPAYVYAARPRLGGFAPSAFSPTWNASAWSLTP